MLPQQKCENSYAESIILLPVLFNPNLPPLVVAEIFPPNGWVSAVCEDDWRKTAKIELIVESEVISEDCAAV